MRPEASTNGMSEAEKMARAKSVAANYESLERLIREDRRWTLLREMQQAGIGATEAEISYALDSVDLWQKSEDLDCVVPPRSAV